MSRRSRAHVAVALFMALATYVTFALGQGHGFLLGVLATTTALGVLRP